MAFFPGKKEPQEYQADQDAGSRHDRGHMADNDVEIIREWRAEF